MSDETNRVDSSERGLKQLLDPHYVLLLACFTLFADIASSGLLQTPLASVRFSDTAEKVSVGSILIFILLFSLFFAIMPALKALYRIAFKVLFFFIYIPARKKHVRDAKAFGREYGVYHPFVKYYAIKKNNIPLWNAHQEYLRELRSKELCSNSLFGLGLLLLVSRFYGIEDSLSIFIFQPLGVHKFYLGILGFCVLGYSASPIGDEYDNYITSLSPDCNDKINEYATSAFRESNSE